MLSFFDTFAIEAICLNIFLYKKVSVSKFQTNASHQFLLKYLMFEVQTVGLTKVIFGLSMFAYRVLGLSKPIVDLNEAYTITAFFYDLEFKSF